MAGTRLIGSYPVIGIRPTIDGRRGKIKVCESLEDQTIWRSPPQNLSKKTFSILTANMLKL